MTIDFNTLAKLDVAFNYQHLLRHQCHYNCHNAVLQIQGVATAKTLAVNEGSLQSVADQGICIKGLSATALVICVESSNVTLQQGVCSVKQHPAA